VTERSVTHATFTIEREYPASRARVFAAFADIEQKRRWFVGPDDWGPGEHEMDFRVGGRELSRGARRAGRCTDSTGSTRTSSLTNASS
jgi:uncharacterized protein YndB with AHSA1/START domain